MNMPNNNIIFIGETTFRNERSTTGAGTFMLSVKPEWEKPRF